LEPDVVVGNALSRFSIAADDKTANVKSKNDKIVERMLQVWKRPEGPAYFLLLYRLKLCVLETVVLTDLLNCSTSDQLHHVSVKESLNV
jgi:hypothetical protein